MATPRSTLDVTTLQFDIGSNAITLLSGLNTLDFEGVAGSDVTLTGVEGLTSTNDMLISVNSNLTIAGTVAKGTVTSTIATAGDVSYSASQVYNGTIVRDTNGANRSDTTPNAVDLIALINGAVDSVSFDFRVVNSAVNYEYITLLPGTGVTITGRQVVSQGEVAHFLCVVTSVAGGTVTMYNVGSSSPASNGGTLYMCSVLGTINNAAQSTRRYCQWGMNVGGQGQRVNNFPLGFAGVIRAISVRFLSSAAITIPVGNSLSFEIGECPGGNPNGNNFSAFAGGAGIIVWTNAQSGTFPSSFVNNVNFPVTEGTEIAFRSVRSSFGITPVAGDINVCLLITLF